MANVPYVRLNNGKYMPGFGLGTYLSQNKEGGEAVKMAIDAGYRHIDCAYVYQNEKEVGDAINEKIRDRTVKRADMFIVTKLWNTYHEPEKVEKACRKSLELLGIDYIDLYLMHWPSGLAERTPFEFFPANPDGTYEESDVDYLDTWKAMENLVDLRLVRTIGISNFNTEQIDRLLANCRIKPVNNQIEASLQINQRKLIKFCKERNIVVTAYSPLGQHNPALKQPSYLYDPKVKAIGDKYNKTPAQIALRYLIQLEAFPIPKSTNAKRIKENIKIFDFKLSPEDMAYLDSLNRDERVIPYKEAKHHKYYPFNIEY